MEMKLELIQTIDVTEVTPHQVKESSRSEYNLYEWNKTVNRFVIQDPTCRFFKAKSQYHDEAFYVVYLFGSIRFMAEICYSSCLSSGVFSFGRINGDKIEISRFENRKMLADNFATRNYMAEQSELNKDEFFTKVF